MNPVNTLLLRERIASECRLDPDDVDFLLAEHRTHIEVAPTRQQGLYRLTPTGYVGTLVGPTCRFIIRPKLPLRNLFHLLDPTARLPAQLDRTLAVSSIGVLDFLAGRLAALLAERSAAGLHRAYAERAGQGRTLQGSLDLPAQLREPGGRKDVLHYRQDDFGPDVPCNQVPRSLVELLLRSPLPGAEVRDALRRVLPAFAAVGSIALTPDAFATAERAAESYRPLLDLCRLLFDSLCPGESAGLVRGPAFLLDMERVFERYVTAGVCRAFSADRFAVEVQRLLAVNVPRPGQPTLQMRPDVVIHTSPLSPGGRGVGGEGENESLLVIDAKWKRLARSPLVTDDIYQMLAYCAGLGARRAVLVYPGKRDRVWRYPLLHAPITVEVRTLRVTGSRRECRLSLARLGKVLHTAISQ